LPIPEQSVAPPSVAVRPLLLYPVSPNPFKPSTRINFELSTSAPARLTIHSAQGHLVRTLLDGTFPFAGGTLTWGGLDHDGRQVALGVYFIRLQQGDQVELQKAVLMH
jgi:hypothetical protein